MTNVAIVQAYLLKLQDRICSALEISDGGQKFHEESWQRAEGGGDDEGHQHRAHQGALARNERRCSI